MQNARLATIRVLLIYGIVIIWWIFSFIIFYPDPDQTTTCGVGLIICIIARVIHQRVNKATTDLEKNQGNEDREQIKHLITVGCAILFILGLLCVALIIISKFLPS
jgi:ABC-type Fe3+ transport system permease subunit